MIQKRTVGVVGVGNVGRAAAYGLFLRDMASEIILVDVDQERAEGEAMDLMHGQALASRVEVKAGDFSDLAAAQLIVVAAGASYERGSSRLDQLEDNAKIFKDIAEKLDLHAPGAILLIATNPVDIQTYIMQELSDRPHQSVIGTGTLLDSARFRALLGEYYDIDPRSVHAYILGEHGDSEVPIWSAATVGGLPIEGRTVLGKPFDEDEMDEIYEDVRSAAYDIVERKGYTDTAIGTVIIRLAKAVLNDERSVLPVSLRPQGAYGIDDVCISLPAVIGLDGIDGRVLPELNDEETRGLRRSAKVLKDRLGDLDLDEL